MNLSICMRMLFLIVIFNHEIELNLTEKRLSGRTEPGVLPPQRSEMRKDPGEQ